MAVNLDAVPVLVLDEGATTPIELVVTQVLAGALARAAVISKGQDDFDLSFSSLLIGLVAGDDHLGSWLRSYLQGVLPGLLTRRNVTRADLEALRSYSHEPSNLPLRRTVSARTALNEADRIHRDSGDPAPSIDARHLVAALISLPQYHDDDFRTLGINRPDWGRAFVPQVSSLYPEESAFWAKWLIGAFPPSSQLKDVTLAATGSVGPAAVDRGLWSFAPDTYSQTDLLDIEREAHGLASLIASHKTTLPLSIGLFGHWGSGKTFFMRHIQSRVRTICQEAQASGKPQADIAFYRHIAQIEFNAWHYSEGELLPSLVDHILQNLRVDEEETEAQVEQRRALLLTQIQDERQQTANVDQQVQEAQSRIAEKESQIEDLRHTQAREREKMATRLTALGAFDALRAAIALDPSTRDDAQSALNRMGVPIFERSARELQTSLGQAQAELSGAAALLLPLLRDEGRRARAVYLTLAIVAPIALGSAAYWALAPQNELVASIAGWVVRGAGVVGALAAWLQKQTAWVSARRREIEKAKLAVDTAIEQQTRELQASQARDLAASLQELDRLRAEHSALVRERDERTRAVEALDLSLARTSSTYLLNQFILERKDATDYRKLLGFMALIRRDFDKLSTLIERSNRAILKGEAIKTEDNPRLNRIVLYIDDLDRCPEDQVVKVLRAVHLLLAFPLFVVVVAVDSRWLTRCLRTQHQAIFGPVGDDPEPGSATPLDYLEKIFQIPLWLQPLTEQQRTDLVTTLLKDDQQGTAPGQTLTAPQQKAASPGAAGTPAGPAAPATGSRAAATQNPSTTRASSPAAASATTGARSDTPSFDLNPTGLTISEAEWRFVGTLASLPLSQTPRVLKRFANTYRLIKSSLSPRDVKGFMDGDEAAPFTVCMFQLAVLTSDSEFAPHYLRALRGAARTHSTVLDLVATLGRALDPQPDDPPPPAWYDAQHSAAWARQHAFFQRSRLHHHWARVSADDYAWWAMRAARFTFVQE